MRVLVVDDQITNRDFVSSILENTGHHVYCAEDGEHGLKIYRENEVDLVVLDVEMPGIDGFETARRMRKIDAETGKAGLENWIPIVFLTAHVDADSVTAGIEAGGDEYITKPLVPKVFVAKLQALERISQMRNQLLEKHHQKLTIEKLESLKIFATGLAAELRNPMAAMGQTAQTIERRLFEFSKQNKDIAEEQNVDLKNMVAYLLDRKVDELFKGIQSANLKAVDILNHLLDLSQGKVEAVEAVDVSDWLAHHLVDFKQQCEQLSVKFDVKVSPGTKIKIMPREFARALLHVLFNALEAVIPHEQRKISLALEVSQKETIFIIKDNGVGISEENLPKVFYPFYTTKSPGQGVGLGLCMAERIVTFYHQGHISIQSKVNKGTTVSIYLQKEPVACGI